MGKKLLYMIGNSHIDPVWFWNWEEGMQEVKATYASALERMKEYPDFIFTSTSIGFFKWIEKIVPDMFEEIKKRVIEGRWEITGGWFIEPDCIIPCGEAFVRQGLYSQRYLKEKFSKVCRIGSNVDSFGHTNTLPQILKKSGMDSYVFMRPRLDTPVFIWESDDGSKVNAISLPAEYTTWFMEPTIKNINQTIERTKGWDKMVCCYGVGNHGGGPTKENIESIISLKDSFENMALKFSTYGSFFAAIDKSSLKIFTGTFEKVNGGCYSMDSEIKKSNRLAERRLIEADCLMSIAASVCGRWPDESNKMQSLWEMVLFNQFHDTLGGTAIKPARDEAVMQLHSAAAQGGIIKALAIQSVVNSIDTRGEGFPLFLFNTRGYRYEGYVDVELDWFCQNPLRILDPQGREVPYQRINTYAKVTHTVLGGRRRVLFKADIPSYGYAMYRLLIEKIGFNEDKYSFIGDSGKYCLENKFIRAEFDKESGLLKTLVDKQNNYNALASPVEFQVWIDQRDTWGGNQGREFKYTGECFKLVSIEKVETGFIRQTIRAIYKHGSSRLEQLYHLYAEQNQIIVENRLYWDKPWHLFKIVFPFNTQSTKIRAESSYGYLDRKIEDNAEYYMHRWVDVTDDITAAGCAVANDSKYSFNADSNKFGLTVLRSAIFSQGNSPNWYNDKDSYEYSDIGVHNFSYSMYPHGEHIENYEAFALADELNSSYEYLADNCHTGNYHRKLYSLAGIDAKNIDICVMKKSEDDEDYIVRLLETSGQDTQADLEFMGDKYHIFMGKNEIKTLKINTKEKKAVEVNLVEWEVLHHG